MDFRLVKILKNFCVFYVGGDSNPLFSQLNHFDIQGRRAGIAVVVLLKCRGTQSDYWMIQQLS